MAGNPLHVEAELPLSDQGSSDIKHRVGRDEPRWETLDETSRLHVELYPVSTNSIETSPRKTILTFFRYLHSNAEKVLSESSSSIVVVI